VIGSFKRICNTLGIIAILAAAASCNAAYSSERVKVLVSSELKSQFRVIDTAFSKKYRKTSLDPVVLPLKQLQKQVNAGKQDGIILTLGPKDITPIDKAGKLAVGSQVILGDVPLVVIVPNKSCQVTKGGVCNFNALTMKHVASIAIGDLDSASVGTETMNALSKAKLWAKVKSKTQRMPLEKLVDAVGSCKVSAAIVTLNQVTSRVKVACYVDPKLYEPIQLLAVRSTGTKITPGVDRAIRFLSSKAARDPLFDTGIREHKAIKMSRNSLFMFCGAGLREPATKLINTFRKKTGIRVEATFTGSGCLLAQITIGQSGDLYMPGEEWYMNQAKARGYVTDSKIVTYFIPVIMVQKGNPKKIHSLKDLLKPGVRVGIGEPKAAAIGDFTPKFLKANGVSMQALKKNVVATFGTAPELGNSIKLGAVDATIQWDAVASWYLDDVDVIAVPITKKTISPVPLGILKFTKHRDEALKFLEFVSGPEGKAIFKSAGHTIDLAHPRFPAQK